MQQTTFADPQVIEYCRTEFVPVQLDLDRDRAEAQRLGVAVVPTLLVLQEDREVDRTSGLQSSQQLLAWLARVGQGPTQLESLRQALLQSPDQASVHYDLAQAYSERQMWPEALQEALWLWDQVELVRQQSLAPVRASYLSNLLKKLVQAHPPAVQALQERLNRLQEQRESQESLRDWLRLSQILGQEAAAADRALAHPEDFRPLNREVFDLLCQQKRWAEAGAWLAQPLEVAQAIWAGRLRLEQGARDMPADMGTKITQYAKASSYRQWRELLQALRAAQRTSEAQGVVDWVRQQDPQAELESPEG
jgi:tetratricopeptide (TPR) repeat protein